jgi:biopolymer transport protein ExbB/TolQ
MLLVRAVGVLLCLVAVVGAVSLFTYLSRAEQFASRERKLRGDVASSQKMAEASQGRLKRYGQPDPALDSSFGKGTSDLFRRTYERQAELATGAVVGLQIASDQAAQDARAARRIAVVSLIVSIASALGGVWLVRSGSTYKASREGPRAPP